jgi:hypothetical protein
MDIRGGDVFYWRRNRHSSIRFFLFGSVRVSERILFAGASLAVIRVSLSINRYLNIHFEGDIHLWFYDDVIMRNRLLELLLFSNVIKRIIDLVNDP